MNLIDLIIEQIIYALMILIPFIIILFIMYKIVIYRLNRNFKKRVQLMREQHKRSYEVMVTKYPEKYE